MHTPPDWMNAWRTYPRGRTEIRRSCCTTTFAEYLRLGASGRVTRVFRDLKETGSRSVHRLQKRPRLRANYKPRAYSRCGVAQNTVGIVSVVRCYSHQKIGRPKNGRSSGVNNTAARGIIAGFALLTVSITLLSGCGTNRWVDSLEELVPSYRPQSDSIGFGYAHSATGGRTPRNDTSCNRAH